MMCAVDRPPHRRKQNATFDVEVDVDAAVTMKNEVADGVGTLDRIRVAAEYVDEGRVDGGDEIVDFGVRPVAELVVAVLVLAGDDARLPAGGHRLADPEPVDDLRKSAVAFVVRRCRL